MRISDWSSDVCSSDLSQALSTEERRPSAQRRAGASGLASLSFRRAFPLPSLPFRHGLGLIKAKTQRIHNGVAHHRRGHGEQDQAADRSEEHTSELQSLMRISYAVFCLKKKTKK